jgi:hypothetical protein
MEESERDLFKGTRLGDWRKKQENSSHDKRIKLEYAVSKMLRTGLLDVSTYRRKLVLRNKNILKIHEERMCR